MALSVRTKRFTVAEYHQMIEANILHEDDRLELIEGEIVQMTPIGPQHAGHVNRLNMLFTSKLADLAIVAVQNPIALGGDSEPQPDIVLLQTRADFYTHSHPVPREVLLLIEVSDSSLPYDRDLKSRLYARAGIPEVWLVDLEGDGVVVLRDPSPDGYRSSRIARRGETLAPLAFPDREIAVSDVLG